MRAFRRIIDTAGPDTPGRPARLIDLAVTLDQRHRTREPHGEPADLDEAIPLTDQAITGAAGNQKLRLRAHRVRAPMLITQDEHTPHPDSADLAFAEDSFTAILQLTPPEHPDHGRCQADLAAVQRLRSPSAGLQTE